MHTILDTLIASADVFHLNGFGDDDFGDVESTEQWNGLATVSPVLLRNVGEHRMADDFTRIVGNAEYMVWHRVDSDGNKTMHAWAGTGTPMEKTLIRNWEHAQQDGTR